MPVAPSMFVGETYKNNKGCIGKVVEYVNARKVKIRFVDEHSFESFFEVSDIRKGTFSNPFHRSTLGLGYMGDGEFKAKVKGKTTIEYNLWSAMMTRSYCPNYHEKFPTYIGCSVAEEFLNYQDFANWINLQPNFKEKGFVLDKDLLVRGNKVYSPETCCLIPQEINSYIASTKRKSLDYPVGVSKTLSNRYTASLHGRHLGTYDSIAEAFSVYKVVKEGKAKEIAYGWKDQIDPRVYNALMSWEVNIDD